MNGDGPNDNGSRFYITLSALKYLDNRHVVFGEVLDGKTTIDKIDKIGTHSGLDFGKTIKIVDSGGIYL